MALAFSSEGENTTNDAYICHSLCSVFCQIVAVVAMVGVSLTKPQAPAVLDSFDDPVR